MEPTSSNFKCRLLLPGAYEPRQTKLEVWT